MSTYEIDQLREMWRLERITEEQAIGQMILHAQKIAQTVPDHEEQLKTLRWDMDDAEREVDLLKQKR